MNLNKNESCNFNNLRAKLGSDTFFNCFPVADYLDVK